MQWRCRLPEQLFEPGAPFLLRQLAQVPSCGGDQVERHECRRRFLRELRGASRGTMKAERQRVEMESACRRDHDLTVDHATVRQALEQHRVELWKIAVERPQIAALDVNLGAAAEDNRAEPVPLGLVHESV